MSRKIFNPMTETLMLLGGGIIGAGLALLLAPQSGRRTRRDMLRFGKTIRNRGELVVDELSGISSNFVAGVRDRSLAILQRGEKLGGKGKKVLTTTIDKGQEALLAGERKVGRLFA